MIYNVLMKHFKNFDVFHRDKRGKMIYLLENVSIRSILYITCKKGSIRANHIHKKDSHYSYLLKGSMKYFYKKGEAKSSPVKSIIVRKNEMVYTSPMETHAMKFLENSIFLAFTTEKRSRNKYEKGLKRIVLV